MVYNQKEIEFLSKKMYRMGANVSKNYQETLTKTKTALKENCTPSARVTQEIKDVTVELRGNARCDNITIANRATASADCSMDSVISTLAEQASLLTTEQRAGLGVNVTDNTQINKQIIEDEIEKNCGTRAAIDQRINGGRIAIYDNAQCDLINFLNEADATSSCVMSLVNEKTSNIAQEAATAQTGMSLFGGIMLIFGIIAGIILLIVITVIVRRLIRNR